MIAHKRRIIKKLNRRGGIEGLPLELGIIVVVAALGCGLLMGWMGNVEPPETIGEVTSSVNQITMNGTTKNISFNINVTDSSGDPIEGATVVLSGCGISKGSSGSTVFATTDSSGNAVFSGLTVTKSTSGVGYVNVSVSAGEYGENSSLKIPVVR